jgi:hypothetical protein
MSIAPTLNISCTCTECTTFLRPMVSSQPYTSSLFASPRTTKPFSTPSWIDKLSLSAYDVQTITPVQPSQPLSPVTTKLNASAPGFVRSAFPKTPGTLRCAHTNCRTRLPISWSLASAGAEPLCEEHSKEVVDDSSSSNHPRRPPLMASKSSQSQSSALSEQTPGLRADARETSSANRPTLSRASSSASGYSLASWDEPTRSKSSVGFGWGASAFESKLCW